MTTRLKLRRGSTTEHASFTGAAGEVTVDTTKKTVVVHDGTTLGGFPLLKENNPTFTGVLTGGTGVINIGSGQFYKDASGNIGIGTTGVAAQLHQYQPTGTTYRIIQNGTVQINEFASTDVSTAAYGTGSNHPLIFTTNNNERVRIGTDGNVSIGTSNPQGQFDVSFADEIEANFTSTNTNAASYVNLRADINAGASAYYRAFRGMDSTAGAVHWAVGQFGAPENTLAFYVNSGTGSLSPSERMRIDSSGNVGIGTTANSAVTNNNKNGLFFEKAGGSLTLSHANAQATWLFQAFQYGGTNAGWIQGTSGGASVSYSTASDYRLKKNVAPMMGALQKVSQLKPVTYKWRSNNQTSQGFIAHELQEVCPEAVTGTKDAVDADGKPQYQGIDTSFLVATLAAAIQELKQIVDAQAIEINALKSTQI